MISEREQRFPFEFLVDCDPVKAAMRCGWASKEAEIIGPELMNKQSILDTIKEERDRYLKRLSINKEMVLREYARLAFSDVNQYYDEEEDGTIKIKTKSQLNRDPIYLSDASAAISEIITGSQEDPETGKQKIYIKKFKLHPKTHSLDALSKFFGIFEKDNAQKRASSPKIEDIINALPKEIQYTVKKELVKIFSNQRPDDATLQ